MRLGVGVTPLAWGSINKQINPAGMIVCLVAVPTGTSRQCGVLRTGGSLEP
jgi:hypothetical protein